MTDQIEIIPGKATLADLENIYRHQTRITISRSAKSRVDAAAEIVALAANGEDAVYGINTGFGKLASTRISPENTARLQRNLILSHCCGVGEPLADEVVILVMVLKLLSLGRGASGVRWCLIEQLERFLHKGLIPVIPGQGSVGASGDLAPLAHMTAALIGEGEVRYGGEIMPTADALKKAGVEAIELSAKEGLGMINGTQVSTALSLAGLFNGWTLMQSALISGAIMTDALMDSTAPFRPEIHALRGLKGQIDAAQSLRSMLKGFSHP